MGILIYLLALVLITAWSIGFIGYGLGGLIHVLLALAVVTVVLRVMQAKTIH